MAKLNPQDPKDAETIRFKLLGIDPFFPLFGQAIIALIVGVLFVGAYALFWTAKSTPLTAPGVDISFGLGFLAGFWPRIRYGFWDYWWKAYYERLLTLAK